MRSRTVLDAIYALNALVTDGNNVTMNWIKAHNGHVMNERADQLATSKNGSELTGPADGILFLNRISKGLFVTKQFVNGIMNGIIA